MRRTFGQDDGDGTISCFLVMSVGGLGGLGILWALSGTSWAAVNWSEYREEVGTMDFRYKLERGKTDQMQVLNLDGIHD